MHHSLEVHMNSMQNRPKLMYQSKKEQKNHIV